MNLDIEKIEAASRAATPGPWQACNGYQGFGQFTGKRAREVLKKWREK